MRRDIDRLMASQREPGARQKRAKIPLYIQYAAMHYPIDQWPDQVREEAVHRNPKLVAALEAEAADKAIRSRRGRPRRPATAVERYDSDLKNNPYVRMLDRDNGPNPYSDMMRQGAEMGRERGMRAEQGRTTYRDIFQAIDDAETQRSIDPETAEEFRRQANRGS
ncbi:MAG: hypothetical protein VXW22_15610 [Pseudomonadota bacterium]|nr:hypothetical protein [Pseudomonadota bacterium]